MLFLAEYVEVPLPYEEVVLQLVASRCLPILMYGSEACGLKQSDIRYLDFTVNRYLKQLISTLFKIA